MANGLNCLDLNGFIKYKLQSNDPSKDTKDGTCFISAEQFMMRYGIFNTFRIMKKYLKVYLAFSAGFCAVIFYFRMNNVEEITRFIIPLFVFIILLFVFLTNDSKNRNNILLFLVFLFVFSGDTIINLSQKKELSIIPFSLAHIFLAIYYILDIKIQKKDFMLLIPVLCFSAFLIILIGEDIPGKSHLAVFVVYLSILDLMFWRALCYLCSGQQRSRTWFIISGS